MLRFSKVKTKKMKYTFVTLIVLLSSICCTAQTAKKFNLDFEVYNADKNLPDGWFKWGGGNCELGIDTINVYSGKYAAKITTDKYNDRSPSIAFEIPANYEGKSIQLEGYMKIQDVENGFGGLVLRIDGTSSAFNNMQSQNINGTNK